MSDNIKRFKKGEFLFKENDPITCIYIVQTGKIALNVERTGKRLEVMHAGPSQVLGEQALFTNSARHLFSGEVLVEAKVMEVPLEVLKTQIGTAVPGVKLVLKSLVDEGRAIRVALRSLKMESDKAPCPQPAIPRIFTILNLVARHTGKKNPEKPNEYTVAWTTLKLYATRMFAESPARIRGMLDLLAKLKYAELMMGQSEEGEPELRDAKIFDLQMIEDFAEFYQYNLYKGSYSEVIHVDALAIKVARALVGLSEGLEPDRRGAVGLVWDTMMTDIKSKYGIDLKGTHLDALEKKGLFVKKQAREKEPTLLMFDRNEFLRVSTFWQLIYEIDKWNEKGSVDMNEKEAAAASADGGCPQCKGAVDASNKFCPHCGFKIQSAA